MHIVTDVDGVLLDWLSGFQAWMAKNGYKAEGCPRSDYRLGQFFGMSEEKIAEFIRVFNEEAPESGQLNYLGGDNNIPKILKEFIRMDYKISIITKFSDNDSAIKKRQRNLYTLFGNIFEDIHIIPIHGCKSPFLQQYREKYNDCNRFWWIEDNIDNAHIGVNMGYRTMLMTHPYNDKNNLDNRVKKVGNWIEVFNNIVLMK